MANEMETKLVHSLMDEIIEILKVNNYPMKIRQISNKLNKRGFILTDYEVLGIIVKINRVGRSQSNENIYEDIYYLKTAKNPQESSEIEFIAQFKKTKYPKLEPKPKPKPLPERKPAIKTRRPLPPLPQLYIDADAKYNNWADKRVQQWMKEGKSQEFHRKVS